MITLLRNLTDIAPPSTGFDCLPNTTETTPSADLARIKYFRNHLSHLDDGKINSTDFNTIWDNLSEVGFIIETCKLQTRLVLLDSVSVFFSQAGNDFQQRFATRCALNIKITFNCKIKLSF